MNKKQTSDFVFGIAGNIIASILIALANILFGRFIPGAPRDVLDIASLVLPLIIIILFFYKDKFRKIHINPQLWISRIREIINQTKQGKSNTQSFSRFANRICLLIKQLPELRHKTIDWGNYLGKAIKPSIIIVTVITVVLIVGFGVSIRWIFEQRTITVNPSIYNSYQQIYDFLAP